MLTDLDRRYTGSMDEFNNESSDVVTPEMIKPLASEKGAFPLCMKSMQCALTDSHHLKYKARLQYGLFLKGIGLSMEDAIRYFRGEFVRGPVDPEKFDKEYTYGIRYNYGKGMDTIPILSCFTVSEVHLLLELLQRNNAAVRCHFILFPAKIVMAQTLCERTKMG